MNERKLYFDSDVFIDLLERTARGVSQVVPIAESATHGEAIIVTSAFTMIEVSKLKNVGLLDEATEELVAQYFENDFISIRNVDRFVAEKARPLVRKYGLTPSDATHVATALLMEVDVMYTFDKGLLKHDGLIDGLKIKEPTR
jgi:predicted nucleic acid-binding protein